jgi:hypothetical protein
MPVASLDIAPELLTNLCCALKEGTEPRSFYVVENGLPDDVEFVVASLVPTSQVGCPQVVRLYLRSASFFHGAELPPVVMSINPPTPPAANLLAGCVKCSWFGAEVYKYCQECEAKQAEKPAG